MATKTLGSMMGQTGNFRSDLIHFGIFYDLTETPAMIHIGLYFTYNCGALLRPRSKMFVVIII